MPEKIKALERLVLCFLVNLIVKLASCQFQNILEISVGDGITKPRRIDKTPSPTGTKQPVPEGCQH